MKLPSLLLATSTLIYQVWGLSQLFEFDQKYYLSFDAKFKNKNGAGLLGHLKRKEGELSNDEGKFIIFKNLGPKTLHFINDKCDFKLTPGQRTHIDFTVDDIRNTWKQVIHVEKS
ncbi:hypothetical protein PGT21_034152 [Puccinia graminis f. sp. tritici]|uniref:Uncharacterized protein n=1 Tax=Puccinia graminis f. sp. tritici TaxID=56615 RepID=A0A5B0QCC1_PUCGR|nr:hypothetical protein PGT21_034152 [Puccinia graminis f. sp. tritici]